MADVNAAPIRPTVVSRPRISELNTPARPSPEDLLARIRAEKRCPAQGLPGRVAGVGKTYAMLTAAREALPRASTS